MCEGVQLWLCSFLNLALGILRDGAQVSASPPPPLLVTVKEFRAFSADIISRVNLQRKKDSLKTGAFKWLSIKIEVLGLKFLYSKNWIVHYILKNCATIWSYIINFLFGGYDWQEDTHKNLSLAPAFLAYLKSAYEILSFSGRLK
jgi:hypothetical protein